jgi:hypothetical protein
MIIGINGKIGVGKDSVGKIIQYLQCYNVGEITIDDVINNPEHEWWLEEQSKFEIKKFAGKLKQIASILTGIPVEMFEDQEFKKTYLGKEWNSPYNIPFSGPDFVKHDGEATVREFLQRLGTEAMRDGLHTNVWCNALFSDYKGQQNADSSFSQPNWIITDMRFENELEAIVKKGGITIRVVRYPKTVEQSRGPENVETIPFDPTNQKHMDLWKGDSSRLHPSETALDDHTMHYEIINDGTIEDLVEKVREILITEKII